MRSTEPLIVDPGPQLAVNLVHLTQKSIWDLVFPRERGSTTVVCGNRSGGKRGTTMNSKSLLDVER